MIKYLFIVCDASNGVIFCTGDTQASGLMKTAHGLIDQFNVFGAERCEIWAQTGPNSMVLLGTAF